MSIHQQSEDLVAFLKKAPGFIAVVMGKSHTFTFANEAYKNFVKNRNLVGLTVADALPDIAAQGFVDILDEVFQSGRPFFGRDVKISVIDEQCIEQESIRYCDFVYQPVRGADGDVTGIICEGYDTTRIHESVQKIANLQREIIHLSRLNAMGTMAATLSHELGQPLTAIANFAEAGRRHLMKQNPQGAINALDAIAEVTDRTGLLVKNLRNLTSGQSNEHSEFNLKAAISECINLVSAAGDPNLRITDRTSNLITVHGDRIQIQQVLINLIKNACEARPGSSAIRINIDTRIDSESVRVSVSDNGTGVSRQAEPSLFAFAESSKENGMGIGLSVSRTIIEGHGGHIWLERTDANGSLFCFSLPLKRTQT